MGQLAGVKLTPEKEGRYFSPKMQWICIHAHFTEADTGKEWDLYYWPAIAPRDEGIVLSLHSGDEIVDLCEFHQPHGYMDFADTGANIDYPGRAKLSGTYPSYELHVDAPDPDGNRYGLDITLDADSLAFEAVRDLVGIDWFYVPRLVVGGALRTPNGEHEVSGTGYIERRRGRFFAPGVRMGIWESLPMPARDTMGVPLFYKVFKNDGTAQVQTFTYTADGQTLIDLGRVEVEILETKRLEDADLARSAGFGLGRSGDRGIEHPIKFQITAEGEEGMATATVTRNPKRLVLRDFWREPWPNARAMGIYGPGHMEAEIETADGTVRTSGNSFGSALFFWFEE